MGNKQNNILRTGLPLSIVTVTTYWWKSGVVFLLLSRHDYPKIRSQVYFPTLHRNRNVVLQSFVHAAIFNLSSL